MNLSTVRTKIGKNQEIILVLYLLKGEFFHRTTHTTYQKVINLKISRSADLTIDLRLVSHLCTLPRNNTQTSSNVVRFTTTDDSNNDLSAVFPLNYWGLRIPHLIISRNSRLSSNFFYFAWETLKKIMVLKLNSCWRQEHPAELLTIGPSGKSVDYSNRSLYEKALKWRRHLQDKQFLWSASQS